PFPTVSLEEDGEAALYERGIFGFDDTARDEVLAIEVVARPEVTGLHAEHEVLGVLEVHCEVDFVAVAREAFTAALRRNDARSIGRRVQVGERRVDAAVEKAVTNLRVDIEGVRYAAVGQGQFGHLPQLVDGF